MFSFHTEVVDIEMSQVFLFIREYVWRRHARQNLKDTSNVNEEALMRTRHLSTLHFERQKYILLYTKAFHLV